MLPSLATITKVSSIVSLIQQIKKTIFGETQKEEKRLKKPYTCDRTKFTDYHIAVIKSEYNLFVVNNATNPKKKMTQAELAVMLNKKLGLNKSRQAYAAVWNSKE